MKVKINSIQSNLKNPRIIKDNKFKKLVKSIKEFPEMLELRPIVIDENNLILGGNMRHKACIEAGLKEVPVKIAKGLTVEQKQEFIIKDNVGFGEWEWDILANEWDSVDLTEWGLDVWENQDDEESREKASNNFVIRCESIEELQEMQKTFKVKGKKINYENFINIYGQK
jgi:ParB-like chromosome segregation protein Spo0J